MSSSQTAIYNMAIGMVGGTRVISTEGDSVELAVLNEIWPVAVDDVVAGRDWSFARTVALLNEVPDPLANVGQVRPCYALPIDSAVVRQVDDTTDFNSDPGYDWDVEGQIIVVKSAVSGILWARYTKAVRETALFDGPFISCLVARLAMELALPVTNSKAMFETMYALYKSRLKDSTTTNAMQGKRTAFSTGKLSRARNR